VDQVQDVRQRRERVEVLQIRFDPLAAPRSPHRGIGQIRELFEQRRREPFRRLHYSDLFDDRAASFLPLTSFRRDYEHGRVSEKRDAGEG